MTNPEHLREAINCASTLHNLCRNGNIPTACVGTKDLGLILSALSAREDEQAALKRYRAVTRYIGADSWDGCFDCIERLRWAAETDLGRDMTADEIAMELRAFYQQPTTPDPDPKVQPAVSVSDDAALYKEALGRLVRLHMMERAWGLTSPDVQWVAAWDEAVKVLQNGLR